MDARRLVAVVSPRGTVDEEERALLTACRCIFVCAALMIGKGALVESSTEEVDNVCWCCARGEHRFCSSTDAPAPRRCCAAASMHALRPRVPPMRRECRCRRRRTVSRAKNTPSSPCHPPHICSVGCCFFRPVIQPTHTISTPQPAANTQRNKHTSNSSNKREASDAARKRTVGAAPQCCLRRPSPSTAHQARAHA